MTREEAIKYGTEWLKDEYLDAKDGAFITIALEALEQEPCEDAISREEAIDACNQSVNILEATDRIKDLPSVYQKAKVGKWITDRAITRCSNCGKGYKDLYFRASIKSYSYCPNCGAKMESEDKE